MGEKTAIEWCDATWNPTSGCTPISQGCQNCWAKRMANRQRGRNGYPADEPFRVTFHRDQLDKPLHWKKPWRIAVSLMGDLFHDDVPDGVLFWVWETMREAWWHTFLVLTKRPERMANFLRRLNNLTGETGEPKLVSGPDETRANHPSGRGQLFADFLDILGRESGGKPPPGYAWPTFDWMEGPRWWLPGPLPNVWLGTSVENQKAADERIPWLLKCPAAVRFLSMEPLLGPVDVTRCTLPSGASCHPLKVEEGHYPVSGNVGHIHWVIAGGESGPGARPMHPDWPRSVRDQCQAAGVPFFFKQWGEWAPGTSRGCASAAVLSNGMFYSPDTREGREAIDQQLRGHWNDFDPQAMSRVGKKAAGRLLDHREWNEMPEVKQ